MDVDVDVPVLIAGAHGAEFQLEASSSAVCSVFLGRLAFFGGSAVAGFGFSNVVRRRLGCGWRDGRGGRRLSGGSG